MKNWFAKNLFIRYGKNNVPVTAWYVSRKNAPGVRFLNKIFKLI